MRVANDWKDYKVIATGDGEKLENWNGVILLRPDPQVIWHSKSNLSKYKGLNAWYHRSETGGVAWQYLKKKYCCPCERLSFPVSSYILQDCHPMLCLKKQLHFREHQ